jgi:hypothetical protein
MKREHDEVRVSNLISAMMRVAKQKRFIGKNIFDTMAQKI